MVNTRYKVGALWAFAAGALNIAVTFALFIRGYRQLINIELAAGRPDEAFIVTFIIPLLTDLIILGGMLWLVGGVGLATGSSWAYGITVTAAVVSLAASFFPMIPAMSRGAFPSFVVLFGPDLLFYFVVLAYLGRTNPKFLWLSFFSGIACVLSFMNGVAGIDKILTTHNPAFIPSQQLNWVGAVAWGVFCVVVALRKAWAYPLGLGAGLVTGLAGLPLAVLSTLEAHRPSMFTPAPVLALALFAVLVIPGVRAWFRAPSSDAPD